MQKRGTPAEIALMIAQTNQAFAVLARTMMDAVGEGNDDFDLLVQVDKDCQGLSDDMMRLVSYAAVWSDDAPMPSIEEN